jgi:2-polyprenyl-3-methyl-5-hydroxy-6-metoxy-1,4-benzoquinol methylase
MCEPQSVGGCKTLRQPVVDWAVPMQKHRGRVLEEDGVRYYQSEHESAYRKIGELGYSQWNDLFDQDTVWTYDHFQNRAFLERVIPTLELPAASATRVLEYGCGTGPAACYLATLGFRVEAVDLIPEAIAIAQRMAGERGVRVDFSVADICALASQPVTRQYDMVLDSFCLQSIVTDQDRHAVFSAVQARLKPNGYYVVSTAMYDPDREYEPGCFDPDTGICYREVPAGSGDDHVVEIDGRSLIPHRRHLTAQALRDELVSAGFEVLSLERSSSADVVCRLGPT